MKKGVLTALLICSGLVNFAQQDKRYGATYSKYRQDSISIRLLNPGKNSFVTIDTVSLQQLADKLNKPKDNFDRTKWLSLLFTVIGLPFVYFTFLRTGRFKNFDFLSEVDKQLIANPLLWCIYDKKARKYKSQPAINLDNDSAISIKGLETILFEKKVTITSLVDDTVVTSADDFVVGSVANVKRVVLTNHDVAIITSSINTPQSLTIDGVANLSGCQSLAFQTQKDKEIDDKVEAFCYYKLNNFENVFQNFGWIKFGNAFKSWERYLIEILLTSSAFNKVVDKALKRNYLSKKFSKRLEKYQLISATLKEDHNRFENNEIAKDVYKKSYERQISANFGKEIMLSKALVAILFTTVFVAFCFLIFR